MFQKLIQVITTHETYGPAMAGAAQAKDSLILNYHSHGDDGKFCVSIARKSTDPMNFFEFNQASLEELVHIEGFGQKEEDGIPLCTALGLELREHYGLDSQPEIYLNGDPAI